MKLLFSLFLTLSAGLIFAQTPVIFLPKGSQSAEVRAASLLRFYLGKMTGSDLKVTANPALARKGPAIFVGKSPAAKAAGFALPTDLPEDAFFLEGKNGSFLLAGGGEMGAEYAAYTLLELLGCRKFSPRDSLIPAVSALQLPDYPARTEVPAYPYRELWYEPAFDEPWARWHKLKTNPQKNAAWGMFVHTFDKLCPPKKYFAEHPEYYAYNGSQRSSGQLCLSNDTVFQIVVASLREQIRQKPGAKYWSVSQNDNYDYCKCARCAHMDQIHGSPAASLIRFVNRVAAVFPDKTISTLAYQYTRQAPTGLQPAPNVNICLCSIECNRGQSIEAGCQDFARDVREWSALTQNLMIWDYVVQFRNYLGPFPNWHTLQPNLQFFQKNGVKMMFEQGSGRDRSEFSDMRAYLLAKLMWNPNANMDSILTDFGDHYYGSSRASVWQYIHDQTERMKSHGNRLWIYDVPQNEPFAREDINERFLLQIPQLFPKPEDSLLLQRIESLVLTEIFCFLENLKCISPRSTDPMEFEMKSIYLDSTALHEMLHDFETRCAKAGIRNLHENNYPPKQYVQDYKAFLRRSLEALFSVGDSILLEQPAATKYALGDPKELTNKLVGETDYRYNWLGFEETDLVATLQISEKLSPDLSSIEVTFLQDQASWIFYPEKVVFEISTDGLNFKNVHEEHLEIVPDGKKAFRRVRATFPPATLRAVRVKAMNQKVCPPWHTCNGNPSWIFADEIMIR